MKITGTHYKEIRDEIQKFLNRKNLSVGDVRSTIREYGRYKDLEKRVRWDLFYGARLAQFATDTLTYADDTHIDTALRRIVRELESEKGA